jgi:3-methyladenine DNA glycosylase AlkD
METNSKEFIDIRKILLENVTHNPHEAKRFFKTTPGSYAEHDNFIGVKVSALRKIATKLSDLPLTTIQELIRSEINEERLLALIILTKQYQKRDISLKANIYQFYMDNLAYVNNWNLVDSSSYLILGAHIYDKDRSILEQLAISKDLWKRRIAIVATLYFIRHNDLDWTFKIAKLLLNDSQDIIQKAIAWMLREAGKKNEERLLDFLEINTPKMRKTTLRCAKENLTKKPKIEIFWSK